MQSATKSSRTTTTSCQTTGIRRGWAGLGEMTIPRTSRLPIGGATGRRDRQELTTDGRSVSNENFVRPDNGVISTGVLRNSESQAVRGPACLLELLNKIRGCTCVRGSAVRRQISNGQFHSAHSTVGSGCFRPPVVHSGGAVRRLGVPLRPTPLPAAERVVARASPSPTRDGFSIRDSNRNTN